MNQCSGMSLLYVEGEEYIDELVQWRVIVVC